MIALELDVEMIFRERISEYIFPIAEAEVALLSHNALSYTTTLATIGDPEEIIPTDNVLFEFVKLGIGTKAICCPDVGAILITATTSWTESVSKLIDCTEVLDGATVLLILDASCCINDDDQVSTFE